MAFPKKAEDDVTTSRVLVAGGSGMLARFCLNLSKMGYGLSMLCRKAARSGRNVMRTSTAPVHPVLVDFRISK